MKFRGFNLEILKKRTSRIYNFDPRNFVFKTGNFEILYVILWLQTKISFCQSNPRNNAKLGVFAKLGFESRNFAFITFGILLLNFDFLEI